MNTAWVTGSSSGIGQAVVQRLLNDGWQVLGWDIAETTFQHPHYRHLQIDLSDVRNVADATQSQLKKETPLAWVHAAGVMHTASLGGLDASALERMWKIHVAATCEIGNLLLPAMALKKSGRAVLISSRVAAGLAGRSQYAATKAAINSLARSWAAELVTQGVTVNLVSPAATDTPMLQSNARQSSTPKLPPIGRLISVDEVAHAVTFLIHPQSAAITGQNIVVCGGASLS